jgi:hypothetical protein
MSVASGKQQMHEQMEAKDAHVQQVLQQKRQMEIQCERLFFVKVFLIIYYHIIILFIHSLLYKSVDCYLFP